MHNKFAKKHFLLNLICSYFFFNLLKNVIESNVNEKVLGKFLFGFNYIHCCKTLGPVCLDYETLFLNILYHWSQDIMF